MGISEGNIQGEEKTGHNKNGKSTGLKSGHNKNGKSTGLKTGHYNASRKSRHDGAGVVTSL